MMKENRNKNKITFTLWDLSLVALFLGGKSTEKKC